MRECRFSLTHILQYEDKIYSSAFMRENTGLSKPIFLHILCSDRVKRKFFQFLLRHLSRVSLPTPYYQNNCDALRDLVPFVQLEKREKHQCFVFHVFKLYKSYQIVQIASTISRYFLCMVLVNEFKNKFFPLNCN